MAGKGVQGFVPGYSHKILRSSQSARRSFQGIQNTVGVINIPMKCQTHDTRPALKTILDEVLLGQGGVFPAYIAVVTVIGFDCDDFTILDQRLNYAMRVTATIAVASSVDSFCAFRPTRDP
jgi:hypothetical protein